MINKKGMWFLTLFSLIIVLSVYYVTMPEELILTNQTLNNNSNTVVNVEESSELASFRAEKEAMLETTMKELQDILTSTNTSIDEKNNAFEKMKELNSNKGLEESLEKKIKTNYKLDAYVKIDGNDIQVIVSTNKHDKELANNIMRTIQEEFKTKKYISVKFQA